LTVTAPLQQTVARQGTSGFSTKTPLALAALLLPLAAWRRRRNLGRLLMVFVLALAGVAGSVVITGCSPGGYFAQPTQTYTITITATGDCGGGPSTPTVVHLTVSE
ncbi:MAG: hypothetical protein FWD64_12685, partial [Acidobacteriaceae bacterium]|nr:hypothetical protein [Acidobacteriaceae bacterium]